MPMRVLIHDDGCGESLDMDGECPRCGFLPDEASVSPVDVAPEDMRKGLSGGRTYLAPGGMRIQGWREPRGERGVGHPVFVEAGPDHVRSAADKIREALTGLRPEQVVHAMYDAGYCPDCGFDLKRPSGTIAYCDCWDED